MALIANPTSWLAITWNHRDRVNGKKDGHVFQLRVWRVILTARYDYYGLSTSFYFARRWHKSNSI